jgi:hypothetical protein
MKVLLVHGIGHCEANPDYYKPWRDAIKSNLQSRGFTGDVQFQGLLYDDVFLKYSDSTAVYLKAVAELAGAAAWHAVADPLSNLFHPSRDLQTDVRWKVGMVAQFCVENDLRRALWNALADTLTDFRPDLIAAHSLGSLVTYDFLRNDARGATLAQNADYLTFGSQINNVFPRSRLFPGPIKVPAVKFWFHLYNRDDHVFTSPIPISDPNFVQVDTESEAGHDPIGTPDQPGYLNHPNTGNRVWATLATDTGRAFFARSLKAARVTKPKPHRRALLVGINQYPDPANRLEGCVNDTFLVSSALQERGFAAQDIRVVLDERATAQAIRERLDWLLEGAEDGMERFFFYSGHGAQMPGYNAMEKVDHVDECLVPWDFAWTKETAIMDDDFFALYSNLPFNARFFAALDCCHAGGMHRDSGAKVRGITPPDDIRHRMLEWDEQEHMWRERKLPALNANFGGTKQDRANYMGSNGATYRIGRGMRGRALGQSVYRHLPPDERGPYLPVIIEACQEKDLSYEYRDGATSYGAFTYSMVKDLRERPEMTFLQLISRTATTLRSLGYRQEPQIIGPPKIVRGTIPGGIQENPVKRKTARRASSRRRH